MPVTAILREALYELAYRNTSSNGTLPTIPFKLRIVSTYLKKIRNVRTVFFLLTSERLEFLQLFTYLPSYQ